MDERRRSLPHQDTYERVGSDAATIVLKAVENRIVRTSGQEPPREDSQIVFSGSEQQVREGFATALLAMGVEINVLPSDIALPATRPSTEDH